MSRRRRSLSSQFRSESAPAETSALLQEPPLASARWLLSFLLAACGAAIICLYMAVCILYWQGQWQFSFHPSQAASVNAAPHDDIRFDATATSLPRLHGWWIPASAGASHPAGAILFLRDGAGSFAGSEGELEALRALGVNVFAFDYRGFGTSAKLHPSEKSVAEDADAAWDYLTGTRHIAPQDIVIYGRRLGAAIAAEAALRHPRCAGLVLEEAQPPLLDRIERKGFARFLPLSLLLHDRFNPSDALARLAVPKLFLNPAAVGARAGTPPLYYAAAADPKSSVMFAPPPGVPLYRDPKYAAALDRFLSKYLHAG